MFAAWLRGLGGRKLLRTQDRVLSVGGKVLLLLFKVLSRGVSSLEETPLVVGKFKGQNWSVVARCTCFEGAFEKFARKGE